MSEVISVENPFGEPDVAVGDYISDLARLAAGSILRYMELYPENLTERYDPTQHALWRSCWLKCRAPYNKRLNMYLNPLGTEEDWQAGDREAGDIQQTKVSAGVVIPDDGKPISWVVLRRVDDKFFGLTGISRRQGDEIERWRSLMTTIRLQDDKPAVELWGRHRPGMSLFAGQRLLEGMSEDKIIAARIQHSQTIHRVFDSSISRRE